MSQKVYVTKSAGAPQILALYAGAIARVLAGLGLAVVRIISDYSFAVMGNQIHGAVFGLVVGFLGIRNFMSVQRLARQVKKSGARFSWSNLFPKNKKL